MVICPYGDVQRLYLGYQLLAAKLAVEQQYVGVTALNILTVILGVRKALASVGNKRSTNHRIGIACQLKKLTVIGYDKYIRKSGLLTCRNYIVNAVGIIYSQSRYDSGFTGHLECLKRIVFIDNIFLIRQIQNNGCRNNFGSGTQELHKHRGLGPQNVCHAVEQICFDMRNFNNMLAVLRLLGFFLDHGDSDVIEVHYRRIALKSDSAAIGCGSAYGGHSFEVNNGIAVYEVLYRSVIRAHLDVVEGAVGHILGVAGGLKIIPAARSIRNNALHSSGCGCTGGRHGFSYAHMYVRRSEIRPGSLHVLCTIADREPSAGVGRRKHGG